MHLRKAEFEVVCGPMFSGKSAELIRRIDEAHRQARPVAGFKPRLDGRYETCSIASHDGRKRAAIAVARSSELLDRADHADLVVVDEVQLLDDEIHGVVAALARGGACVVVAGLDLDFRAEPFGPMPRLIETASVVRRLTAVCARCGEVATRSQRLLDGTPAPWDDPTVKVGGAGLYEPRCEACHDVRPPGSRRAVAL